MPEENQKGLMKLSTFHFWVITLFLLYGCAGAATVVVDGVSEWKYPVAQIGDSIIFRPKNNHLKLYIFRNERAFSTCNFTEATLLSKPDSASYTWHTSRPGIFYFSFSNGTSSTCEKGQKWAIKVVSPLHESVAPAAAPKSSPPTPVSGGIISSSPGYKFPSLPPGAAVPPAEIPGLVPQKGGGIAVIDSNPAVPLPTDAADSTTVAQPVHASHGTKQVIGGFHGARIPIWAVACLIML